MNEPPPSPEGHSCLSPAFSFPSSLPAWRRLTVFIKEHKALCCGYACCAAALFAGREAAPMGVLAAAVCFAVGGFPSLSLRERQERKRPVLELISLFGLLMGAPLASSVLFDAKPVCGQETSALCRQAQDRQVQLKETVPALELK